MSDNPETFDQSSVRLGVWMGGSEVGNSGHGLYSDINWRLFDVDENGQDVVMGLDGKPLPFGPDEILVLPVEWVDDAVEAADEAAEIGDPLYVDLVVVSELTGKTWFLRDAIGALSTSFLVAKNTIDN